VASLFFAGVVFVFPGSLSPRVPVKGHGVTPSGETYSLTFTRGRVQAQVIYLFSQDLWQCHSFETNFTII
jgi:hypothetical protein